MKTIGLIGGMGWQSSKLYYERINKRVNEKVGGSHSAKIILVSVDFAEIEQRTFNNDWIGIGSIMAKSAKQLEKAGADIVLLCTNLIHIASQAIIENTSLPFLHIADTTGVAIQEMQLKKILLLGTKDTMEKDFYTKILHENYGLEVIIPNETDRKELHDMIYSELLKGIFTDVSKQKVIALITKARSQGAEGVILGCTELGILLSDQEIGIPAFDTGDIHVNQAVTMAIN
ncbi:amino acid racemase [Aquimarina sp. D1M17]|uniref:aspartate/glutamate racemase family protein n=1 Tax=Aquimarina acroporae TaxID=2937283 RepID=UPI0020C120C5|nr:amino acid racemase [Aquimarina acroporae]MCK8520084.1 amino acid racemase [Aquimarina acroporae]